jgi:hypothetical protein
MRRESVLVVFMLLAFPAASDPAVRSQLNVRAEAHNACAPFDGAAIDIVIAWPEVPGKSLRIALWGAGLQALRCGHAVGSNCESATGAGKRRDREAAGRGASKAGGT